MNRTIATLILVALVISVASVMLLSCAKPPEPVIVTKTVNVSVPVACNPDLGPRPELMTKDQIKAAIAATPNFDDRVKLLTAQVLLYIGWVPVLEGGLKGCKGVPVQATTNAGN